MLKENISVLIVFMLLLLLIPYTQLGASCFIWASFL